MRKLLFFYASWCGPCKVYGKEIIDPLEQIAPGKVERIDAWKEPWKASKYRVERLPIAVLAEDGKAYKTYTGAFDIQWASEWLKGGNNAGINN